MFQIGRLYHLTHVVGDLEQANAWYRDFFCGLHVKHIKDERGKWSASIVVVGDLIIEAMQPIANAPAGPVGNYHAKYGEHMYSLAMFVDSVADAGQTLANHGIRLYDVSGNAVAGLRASPIVWTHPRDTLGQYEFAEVPPFHFDPRFHPAWTGRFWQEEHPLGIEGLSHVTVLVHQLDDATSVYRDAFGGACLSTNRVPGERSSAYFSLGPDLVIEATTPERADSVEARDLKRVGDSFFGLTFKVRDLESVVEYASGRGHAIGSADDETVTLDPAQTFGMSVSFTTRSIANDHRAARARPESASRG